MAPPVRPVEAASTVALGADRRAIRWAIAIMFATAIFGIIGRFQIMLDGLARPLAANIFFRLYALHELPFLVLLLVATLIMAVVAMRRRDAATLVPLAHARTTTPPGDRALVAIAGIVFVVSLAATYLVMHGLLFSMDEFGADFQARLLAEGHLAAPLPADWRPFAPAMTPVFVTYLASSGQWLSSYLPGYALLKAPFVALTVPELLNPLLAALTVLVVAGSARRLWPDDGLRQWIAIALLSTSSQFLATSATGYSMPAHLLLNMTWLWLYLRGDDRSWWAALGVGVLALGLHQPIPHALFVAPFVIRLLRDRRWNRVASAALVYGAGSALWLTWIKLAQPTIQAAGGVLSIFALPGLSALWVNSLSFSLLLTWQAPVFGLLALVAILRARELEAPTTDLALGVVLTLGFYLCYPSSQGHGWGHRYAYQVLGNLVLLAAAGAGSVRALIGESRTRALVASWVAVAVLVQLPLRAYQIERFVAPFARGYSFVTSRQADVVLVHGGSIWYGRDLLRNDPFLSGQPVVLEADMFTPAGRAALVRMHPGRIVEISDDELLRLGMTRASRIAY